MCVGKCSRLHRAWLCAVVLDVNCDSLGNNVAHLCHAVLEAVQAWKKCSAAHSLQLKVLPRPDGQRAAAGTSGTDRTLLSVEHLNVSQSEE